MEQVSNWMHVELFFVDQAAALWCGLDPASVSGWKIDGVSEVAAIKQLLTGAILSKNLDADASTNPLARLGDHGKSIASRASLEDFARSKKLHPAFLFDTLLPFADASAAVLAPILKAANDKASTKGRGGRPAEYDWNSFTLEIIYRANQPDGLPDTQAELINDMLGWFSATSGKEPAESAVKERISKIYNYLKKAKNLTE